MLMLSDQNYTFPISYSIITDKHFLLSLCSYLIFTSVTIFVVFLHSFYLSYPVIREKIFSFHTQVGYQIKHEAESGILELSSPIKGAIDTEAGIVVDGKKGSCT